MPDCAGPKNAFNIAPAAISFLFSIFRLSRHKPVPRAGNTMRHGAAQHRPPDVVAPPFYAAIPLISPIEKGPSGPLYPRNFFITLTPTMSHYIRIRSSTSSYSAPSRTPGAVQRAASLSAVLTLANLRFYFFRGPAPTLINLFIASRPYG